MCYLTICSNTQKKGTGAKDGRNVHLLKGKLHFHKIALFIKLEKDGLTKLYMYLYPGKCAPLQGTANQPCLSHEVGI